MKYPFHGISLILTIALFSSCNQNEIAASKRGSLSDGTAHSLAGQIYWFSLEYDSSNSKFSGDCDCCSANTLFLNDSVCLYIDYCDETVSYLRGTYFFKDSQMEMKFDDLNVQETFSDTEPMDSSTGAIYIIDSLKSGRVALKVQENKGKIVFLGPREYGVLDTSRNFSETFNIIKEKGIWDRLTGKSKIIDRKSPAASMPDLIGNWSALDSPHIHLKVRRVRFRIRMI